MGLKWKANSLCQLSPFWPLCIGSIHDNLCFVCLSVACIGILTLYKGSKIGFLDRRVSKKICFSASLTMCRWCVMLLPTTSGLPWNMAVKSVQNVGSTGWIFCNKHVRHVSPNLDLITKHTLAIFNWISLLYCSSFLFIMLHFFSGREPDFYSLKALFIKLTWSQFFMQFSVEFTVNQGKVFKGAFSLLQKFIVCFRRWNFYGPVWQILMSWPDV